MEDLFGEELTTGELAASPGTPVVLLLGAITHEGIVSALKASGAIYVNKLLESGPANWESIIKLFDFHNVRAVLVKISGATYSQLAAPRFKELRAELFKRIAPLPHAVFVYENLLTGRETSELFTRPDEEDRVGVNAALRDANLNIVPYRTNSEVTVIGQQLVSDAEQGLLFRIYVPAGRIWGHETDRLLKLFREYLGKVYNLKVRMEEVRTDRGTIYELHGQESSGDHSLSDEFKDFSVFLDLAASNPAEAEEILRAKNVDPREIADILSRYSKESRRLQVDMRQERERKVLAIRHRLESELSDANVDGELLFALADSAIPRSDTVPNPARLLSAGPMRITTGSHSDVTVNISPSTVHAVHAIVAEEISGNIQLTGEDRKLIETIQQEGGAQVAELTSAVHELSDDGVPQGRRIMARQKLKSFVIGAASKLGDTASGLLLSYLETKLGIN